MIDGPDCPEADGGNVASAELVGSLLWIAVTTRPDIAITSRCCASSRSRREPASCARLERKVLHTIDKVLYRPALSSISDASCTLSIRRSG